MNPLANMTGGNMPNMAINPQAIQGVKQLMSMMQTMRNPQQAIMQMAQQNPQLNAVMNLVNGKNPKDVFYAECQKRGIDPNTIINQLR
jgi:hypothetical protein